MTHHLHQSVCEPCRSGGKPATGEEISQWIRDLPDWQITEQDGIARLEKVFTFKNFRSALAFTNETGALAEAQKHHPALLTEWGKVTVSWWTHAIGGLHKNDFIMAAKTDHAFKEMSAAA